jgi:lysophospholipase L1-like esterase
MALHARHRRASARAAMVLLIGAVAASCGDRADSPVEPGPGGLLDRYVALGNSITASFQSGGLHAGMQNEAYPVILARKAGVSFGVPELAYPGCPPPFAAPLTVVRISEQICAGRALPLPPLVQNLAVPGATVAHALTSTGTGSGLDLLIVGARSQVQAMRDARPTFVSVWLGNNDALGAALRGDPGLLTPLADFRASYDQVVDAIRASTAQGAILIGVADAARMAPALQPGAFFWALARAPDLPLTLEVGDNCAPFSPTGEPNPAALRHLVSFQAAMDHLEAGSGAPLVIDCAADAPYLLNQAEQEAIERRVGDYNAHIRQRAQENGWIYVDPGVSLVEPALANPDDMRKCQYLDGALDEGEFFAAVEASCPGRDAPNFFGTLLSFDGVHPSSAGHAVIADTLAARLNERYGLTLTTGH